MKSEFLVRREGHLWLILVFDGWASDAGRFDNTLWPEGYDVLRVSDYSDFDFDTSLIKPYRSIHLYAWSFGVFAASRVLSDIQLDSAYALCGTETPVSDTGGIPADIFRGTLNALSPRNLAKFRRRMFASADDFKTVCPDPQSGDIEALKAELRGVEGESRRQCGYGMDWNAAVVAEEDRIFPPDAQRTFWTGRTTIVSVPSPHYVDIQAIARRTLIEPGEVARCFGRSMNTYDANALPQRRIARRLARLIADAVPMRGGRMLEVGPGTGMLTRELAGLLVPEQADFVDVCRIEPFGLFPSEHYHTSDAAAWLASAPDASYDYVVSSSAVQWINGLEPFMADCRRVLRPGGMLAISTFAPGNLGELDSLGVPSLRYAGADRLREMLQGMSRIQVICEEEKAVFADARHALMHLKLTGVTAARRLGSPQAGSRLSALLPRRPDGSVQLTYRPVYIIAFAE